MQLKVGKTYTAAELSKLFEEERREALSRQSQPRRPDASASSEPFRNRARVRGMEMGGGSFRVLSGISGR